MSTLTHLSVHEAQVRVDPRAGGDAIDRVTGQHLVVAVARLRHGPGQTCEQIARVLDRGVVRAHAAGLDPTQLVVSSAIVVRGEDIVRVRRKAHGKADWIASVTSDVTVELTPSGLYKAAQSSGADLPQATEQPAALAVPPCRAGDPDHPWVPLLRERLLDVIDPDLGINVVDLGFVRRVAVDHTTAVLTMTLTSAACPVTGVMEDQIRTELLGGEPPLVDDFRIDWEWTPAWNPSDITAEGREQLRAIGFTIGN
ncbi:hypothetical protein JCM10369A_30550 [Nocardioides pyridinolyticus]